MIEVVGDNVGDINDSRKTRSQKYHGSITNDTFSRGQWSWYIYANAHG